MDEFPGILHGEYGLRPQGKPVPKASVAGSAPRFRSGAGGPPLPADLFSGGGGKYASAGPAFASDPFFRMGAKLGSPTVEPTGSSSSSMPVYDKPVYDDDGDIFSGVPGLRKSSSASTARHGDVFPAPYDDDLLANLGGARSGPSGDKRSGASYGRASPPPYDDGFLAGLGGLGDGKRSGSSSNPASPPYDDDLLVNLGGGKGSSDDKRSGVAFEQSSPSYEDVLLAGLGGVSKRSSNEKGFQEQDLSHFDDLLPGFGGSSLPKQRRKPLEKDHQQTSSSTKSTATGAEDPFVVLETTAAATYSSSGLFTDPLEHIKPSGDLKSENSSAKDGGVFDDINGFDGSVKSVPSFSFDMENNPKDRSPLETAAQEPAETSSAKAPDNKASYQTLDGKSNKSSESYKSVNRNGGPTVEANTNPYEASTKMNASQRPEEHDGVADEIWLTVSEIPLFTQPTSAPPPSRPPPHPFFRNKPTYVNTDESSSVGSNDRIKANESSSHQPTYPFPRSHNDTSKVSAASSIDELEDFVMGKPQAFAAEAPTVEEEVETSSAAAASAAAMKEAMDRAEAKFKHAREVWERERDLRSSKSRETAQQVRDEDGKEKERLDQEREQREREEKETERRRLEKMRELELEKEKGKARQAVERANREARERAAADARQKAERSARERAERAAVQRAQSEARERAAAGAKERAERLAAERERAEAEARERAAAEVRNARERDAREKAAVEAREKAERAAVERAAAEVRARAQRAAVERAAAEARERAAAMAREKQQQKNESDLDSFFGMGARANSAPRERSNSHESAFDSQFQNMGKPSGTQKTSSGSSSSMKRPSSTTNIMDDLTSVFRTSSSEEFQEIQGEPEERRRARIEREQRTRQRAAKALAEKNERELQMQREQAERDRFSESLNAEIKRWAAGKEGNLRALLSTLQYVLWPDSGWQPVSLTDLIIAASVKKVYRKATLCVHPDKVRSGSVQQKYIAEKVFDLLKEAWNKFNSEELF
uniref:Auxilin-related protein 2 n=1 Tax=Anthurium amnicola TaxID=1678845 RepID=A0A1D1YVN7_9ARAE